MLKRETQACFLEEVLTSLFIIFLQRSQECTSLLISISLQARFSVFVDLPSFQEYQTFGCPYSESSLFGCPFYPSVLRSIRQPSVLSIGPLFYCSATPSQASAVLQTSGCSVSLFRARRLSVAVVDSSQSELLLHQLANQCKNILLLLNLALKIEIQQIQFIVILYKA